MSLSFTSFAVAKLSDHARIQAGFPFKSERFTSNTADVPLVKGENVQQGYVDWGASKYWPESEADAFAEFVLGPGDVVVAMDRPWVQSGLKWAYIKEGDPKALLVQRVAALRARKSLDQTYLRCLISSGYFANYIQPIVTGVNVPHISAKQIGAFLIPLPQLPVQRGIAAILSAYDDLIANNQRRIALLESMAEKIYREWFVRMRFPGHQGVQRFKGLPSSWTLKSFKDFCVLKRGYDLPDSSMQPGHYPVIASTSITGFHNEFKVNPPVITTGRSGSLGTVLLVNKKSWPLNTALYVKDFCGNSPFLIYYTLRSLKLETFNVGAGVPTLNRNHLASLGIAVPDADLQRQFDAVLGPMNAQASMLAEVNEKLTVLRDALLPRLISGKLKVDHLDIQLPPSMREKVTA